MPKSPPWNEKRRKSKVKVNRDVSSRLSGGSGGRGADTYYVGYIKGVGKIYQQTFIDTYSRVAFAKVYDRKMPLLPQICLMIKCCLFIRSRKLTSCVYLLTEGLTGSPERYQLYLNIEDIDHTRTKAKKSTDQWYLRAVPPDNAAGRAVPSNFMPLPPGRKSMIAWIIAD
ncbi:hypothetical protein DYBT9275_03833 [Dyadobacter sp. CECT 9275]|uniref:Uncharacterized protein n=1 Tax=Dyadobacter helix TaxID=2822344 RepID=A0A916JE63_9BACT|nr:hypothetical protein DYBT9275_03833 [Dyadobacter sp. CECT 9275]